jgi:hypothetical protein
MKNEKGEIVFEDLIRFRILPFKGVDTLKVGSTTPSVANLETWIAANTGAITITNFMKGSVSQRLYILGDGFTSVANNTTIKTNTGAVKLLAVNKVYRFTLFNNIWIEDA